MTRAMAIGGTVRTPAGLPVKGAKLTLVPRGVHHPGGVTGKTDADGRFRLNKLRPDFRGSIVATTDHAESEWHPVVIAGGREEYELVLETRTPVALTIVVCGRTEGLVFRFDREAEVPAEPVHARETTTGRHVVTLRRDSGKVPLVHTFTIPHGKTCHHERIELDR
jgi:hypothetical protein